MAIAKIVGSQRDFSAGEIDASMKRADDNPIMKAGARQLSNWRIKNSKGVVNRPGRTALFLATGRIDEIQMSPGNIFYLNFAAGALNVYNAAGAQVFTTTKKGDGSTAIPWTLASVKLIVWDIYQLSIYIAYGDGAPANVPQILTWDGVSQTSNWTLSTYAEIVNGNQKRTPFYRISPIGVTLRPAAASGSGVTVTASAAVFTAASVGTRIRYVGRQLLITGFTSTTSITATVEETLNYSYQLTSGDALQPNQQFSVGDVVISEAAGNAKGEVTAVTNTTFNIVMLSGLPIVGLSVEEDWVGPAGIIHANAADTTQIVPEAVTNWDDEVMNAYRGYPTSVTVDQGRLLFCNFPSVPSGIAWSSIGVLTDLYVVANSADNGIFEIAPGKSQVMYVVAGPESSEFVFCNNGLYYIPITSTNPLTPGSVAFNLLSKDGCAPIQPRVVQELILWINAGLTSVLAVVAPGAYYRPYEVRNLSELHAHLFNAPVCIAVPSTTAQFEERYAYVLNGDGTIAVGKYNVANGQIVGIVGWLPWNGAGTSSWISALGSDVVFSTSYAPGGITAVNVIEKLDNTQYLDSAMSVNNAPTAFAPPGGKGPLWYIASGNVSLMDNSTRMMGTYTLDANGNIIPQNNGGENLASVALVAGQPWTGVLEPFVPDAPPGQSSHQRMFKRRVSRMAVYVRNSTGFLMARLFSGPLTRTSPALGTIMNTHRVDTWNQDDDPTQPPPLREEVQRWRPIGRAYDPRVAIIKDTPGPLEIPELTLESTI